VSERDQVLAELLDRCRRDHERWINGDGAGYALPEDGTILGALGGHGPGGRETAEVQHAVAQQWASGQGEVELLNGAVDEDLAWLTMIERARVTFVGDDHERRWDLRVTEVFRRIDGDWQRVHRHADPLVDRHPLTTLLDLEP
jgi:hypothetical protein